MNYVDLALPKASAHVFLPGLRSLGSMCSGTWKRGSKPDPGPSSSRRAYRCRRVVILRVVGSAAKVEEAADCSDAAAMENAEVDSEAVPGGARGGGDGARWGSEAAPSGSGSGSPVTKRRIGGAR